MVTVLLYGVLDVKRFQLRNAGFGVEVTAFHDLRQLAAAFIFRYSSGGIGCQTFIKPPWSNAASRPEMDNRAYGERFLPIMGVA